MIDLGIYLRNVDWDGHMHLFNSSQSLFELYNPKSSKLIGFADIEFDHINDFDGKMIDIYDNYIKNHYNNNQILLATAPGSKEAIAIYEKFPNIIKGFGELKLYNKYRDKEIPYKKISIARDIAGYSSKNNNLPVYIHYSLTNTREANNLNNLLKSYPTVPIVLCHCGMESGFEDCAFYYVVDLMKKYSNLWVDISYIALDYFISNYMKLYNLDLDRIILGSDINIKMFGKAHKDPCGDCELIMRNLRILYNIVNSDNNIKKLFQL